MINNFYDNFRLKYIKRHEKGQIFYFKHNIMKDCIVKIGLDNKACIELYYFLTRNLEDRNVIEPTEIKFKTE